MIATGKPEDDGRNTEIIDVKDSNFSCTNIERFPIKLYAATGGLMNGQTPFICGGIVFINGEGGYSNDCHQLTEAGSWAKDQRASLTTERAHAGYGTMAVLNNNLFLIGGYYNNLGYLASTEMLSPDTTSKTLSVELPTGISSHCQVPWDSEIFFIIGGRENSRFRVETHYINVKTQQLANGPSLNTARANHACAELQLNGKTYSRLLI